MKIGIVGGTFNPPHIGHLILAEDVRQKLSLDKIFFIPTNIPPHKDSNTVEAFHRLAMVKCAVANNFYFEVLDIEIRRSGVSYTVDTVLELKRIYPNVDFHLIVGSDLANEFVTWKDFDTLKTITKIVVVARPQSPISYKDDFDVVTVVNIDISSSQIRTLIKKGLSVKYLVPEGVLHYIDTHGLYRQ